MMNWFGKKSGEGIEYHAMLLSLLLVIIMRGGGAAPVDLWLTSALWHGLLKSLM